MTYEGAIFDWDDGIAVKKVVVLEGPMPAASFERAAAPTRIDRYALVASLNSGMTAIVHCDDLIPSRLRQNCPECPGFRPDAHV